MSRHTPYAHLAWGLVFGMLAGCSAGPDFQRQVPAGLNSYTRSATTLPAPGGTEVTQHLETSETVEPQWWQRFRNPDLNKTVTLALADSPTLDSARATLGQARAALAIARGGEYPQLDLAAGVSRTRSGLGGEASNLFSIGPLVSFNLDPFGSTRRLVEQQGALLQFQQAQLTAAQLTLSGSTVSQAVSIAAAREQIQAVREIIALDERTLELVRIAELAGHVAHTDVLSAESQLASDRTLLPPLQQQLSLARHSLALLAGKTTSQWSPPDFDFATLTLPANLPLTLPSPLVRQRPDIRAAEAQLHAANAAIGVATANLYPSLNLSASWTSKATTVGGLFGGTIPWNVALNLVAPLFHGGALSAQRQEAVEAYAAQLGLYRQTVLTAFSQVADVLRALEHDADLLVAEQGALSAAQASFSLMQQSYQAGQSNLLQVLDAQRQYQQARLSYARTRSQRYLDTVQFFTAMGGGWYNDGASQQ